MKKVFLKRVLSFWNSKLPPLLVITYYLMSLSNFQAGDWYKDILLFLLSSAGFGVTGYLINDWADIKENHLQQRANFMSGVPFYLRFILVLLPLAVAVIPWHFLLLDKVVAVLLSLQILSYLVYSFYPFRLKERGVAGLILDAIYAHVLPAVLVIYAFSKIYRVDVAIGFLGWALVLAYFGVTGVRNILMHQLNDFEDDKKAGSTTFVVSYGWQNASLLKNRFLVPTEVLLMLGLYFLLPGLRIFCAVFAAYVVYVFFKESTRIRRMVLHGGEIDYNHYDFLSGVMLNEFYEKWQPVLFLCIYMFQVPLFRTVLIFHLLVFPLNTLSFYADAWFIFFLIILPFKLALRFIWHHGLLKALTLIYYHTKHAVYWYFYLPIKRRLAGHD